MLVLTRVREQAIVIGDDIEVRVLDIRGDRVRLGIVAPAEVSVHRKEIYLAIKKENEAAARAKAESVDEAMEMLRDRKRPRREKRNGESSSSREDDSP